MSLSVPLFCFSHLSFLHIDKQHRAASVSSRTRTHRLWLALESRSCQEKERKKERKPAPNATPGCSVSEMTPDSVGFSLMSTGTAGMRTAGSCTRKRNRSQSERDSKSLKQLAARLRRQYVHFCTSKTRKAP